MRWDAMGLPKSTANVETVEVLLQMQLHNTSGVTLHGFTFNFVTSYAFGIVLLLSTTLQKWQMKTWN